MISVLDIVEDTMVDGPGFRTTIYCAGCPNHCLGCHNPQSWNIDHGHEMQTDEIMDIIEKDPFANVTFSGGDPMFQPEGFTELAKAIHERTEKTIWCFTGFNYKDLLKNEHQYKLLEQIDVLVDGPFIKAFRDTDLIFRGSSNQKIINVPESLRQDKVILENLNL